MEITGTTPYLRVNDIQRSIDFYERALGFDVRNTQEWEGRLTWAYLQNGQVSLMLGTGSATALPHTDDEEDQHGAPWHGPGQATEGIDIHTATWVYVPDVDGLHRDLKAGGWDVLSDPVTQSYGVREFLLRDPDGYHYLVGSRVAAEGSGS